MISTTQANNSAEALRRYRAGWDLAFSRTCPLCDGKGYYLHFEYMPAVIDGQCVILPERFNCFWCKGTGIRPEGVANIERKTDEQLA